MLPFVCRLFGMSGGDRRVRATFWLLEAPDSLARQSRREPDGTGVGWFDDDGSPRLAKQPLAAYADPAFAREARELESTVFLAHIRYATTGAVDARNTHPFEQRGRLFALVTRATDQHGGDVGAGITAAARWVAEHLPVYAMNILLATGEDLWALRYPDVHELWVLERAAGGPRGRRHLDAAGAAGTVRVRSEHLSRHPSVLVASEPMDEDPGWRLLESGELIHVGPTLGIESSIVLDGPPLRQLALHDLEPGAAVAQAPSSH